MKGHAGKEIIKWLWFSGQETVGVILYRNGMGKYRVVMGPAHFNRQEADVQYIADYGAKLTYKQAVGFFPELKEEEYKHE